MLFAQPKSPGERNSEELEDAVPFLVITGGSERFGCFAFLRPGASNWLKSVCLSKTTNTHMSPCWF